VKTHVAIAPHKNATSFDMSSPNIEESTTPATSSLAISSKKSPVFTFNSFLVMIVCCLLNVTKVIIVTIKNKLSPNAPSPNAKRHNQKGAHTGAPPHGMMKQRNLKKERLFRRTTSLSVPSCKIAFLVGKAQGLQEKLFFTIQYCFLS
jgi:hypothetical protein